MPALLRGGDGVGHRPARRVQHQREVDDADVLAVPQLDGLADAGGEVAGLQPQALVDDLGVPVEDPDGYDVGVGGDPDDAALLVVARDQAGDDGAVGVLRPSAAGTPDREPATDVERAGAGVHTGVDDRDADALATADPVRLVEPEQGRHRLAGLLVGHRLPGVGDVTHAAVLPRERRGHRRRGRQHRPGREPGGQDGRQDGRAEGPHCPHEPVAASASGSDIAACVDSSGPQPNCSIHASGMVGTS